MAGDLINGKTGKKATILALVGELGSGKTTFVQGFATALGIKRKITSPSFVIMRRYQLNNSLVKRFSDFYHLDCYRINEPMELTALGFQRIINHPGNIIIIEWADKIKPLISKNAIWMNFGWVGENERKIEII